MATVGSQWCQAEAVGPADADFTEFAAGDFDDFQLKHDLGLGHIVNLDHLLHHLDGLRCVAHHQQIQFLVHHHIAPFEQGLQCGSHISGIGVGELE